MNEIHKSIVLLRNDAIERGMAELAIALGWSAIRIGEEVLQRKMTQIEIYRIARENRSNAQFH